MLFAWPGVSHAASLIDLQQQLERLMVQIESMKQETNRPLSATASCPKLGRSLQLGARGDDVRELQRFLATTGDFEEAELTQYFGVMTERALQRFQVRSGIVSSGSPSSTGYGSMGPATRRAIAKSCGETGSVGSDRGQPVAKQAVPPAPTITTNALDELMRDIDGIGAEGDALLIESAEPADTYIDE